MLNLGPQSPGTMQGRPTLPLSSGKAGGSAAPLLQQHRWTGSTAAYDPAIKATLGM